MAHRWLGSLEIPEEIVPELGRRSSDSEGIAHVVVCWQEFANCHAADDVEHAVSYRDDEQGVAWSHMTNARLREVGTTKDDGKGSSIADALKPAAALSGPKNG